VKQYDIIYADPPWDYKGQKQHSGKGGKDTGSAAKHYGTLKLSDLKQLPVAEIAADDCLLFMWSSSPHLDQGIDLMKAWGFKWATVGFVWNKMRVNPGFYTMSQCELCLIGKRGRIPEPRGARNVRQLVESLRGAHSVKPAEVRERIVEMFPTQSKIELFARQRADGWDAWGDEVKSDIIL
jgi:N6-adenosine-specific RNA methylase IME4